MRHETDRDELKIHYFNDVIKIHLESKYGWNEDLSHYLNLFDEKYRVMQNYSSVNGSNEILTDVQWVIPSDKYFLVAEVLFTKNLGLQIHIEQERPAPLPPKSPFND